MKDSYNKLIYPRIYIDTFQGGQFCCEMTENLCEIGPCDDMDMRDWDLTNKINEDLIEKKLIMWKTL